MLTYLLKRGRRGTQKRLSVRVSASPDSTSSPLSSGAILRCPSFGWGLLITVARLYLCLPLDFARPRVLLPAHSSLMGSVVAHRAPPFD